MQQRNSGGMSRINTLDYLRGLSALGIMLFHFLSKEYGEYGADTVVGRIGVYGVSVFYILSGITLYYVYYQKLRPRRSDLIFFAKKRVLRIFPLLWFCTVITLVLTKSVPNLWDLFLNLTGLYGFVKWDTYYVSAAWSIGNELVFYSFFPLFVFCTKEVKMGMTLLSAFILFLFCYYTFFVLKPTGSLDEQWTNYVNPLNQIMYFLTGFLIGHLLGNSRVNNTVSGLLVLVGVLVFLFYPSAGDPINLVTGSTRVIFSLAVAMVCIGFYKSELNMPRIIHKPLILLGDISYSVYLLHNIVYNVLDIFLPPALPSLGRIFLALGTTIVVSIFSFYYFEKRVMAFGTKKARSGQLKSTK